MYQYVSICINMYQYVSICVCVCVCIYIYTPILYQSIHPNKSSPCASPLIGPQRKTASASPTCRRAKLRVMILWFFKGFFFGFQSGAVLLAICCILEPKSLICMLFATFWSDLHAICSILDLKSAILNAICSISELKPQIWVAKVVNLHCGLV